jgi:hypothetical protein
MSDGDYIKKRKKLSGVFFETALPNEYLVEVGKRTVKPVLGGRTFRLGKKILRVPASVETLYFSTDNANLNYQGIGVDGYASWRIDPGRPEVAIATLDFFDEDNPMRNTNEKLKTICVEAVRHVIANMTIDDALKKKDEIGNNLKEQLRKFEDKWGILFDQVGIEQVRIMSERLFEDLQSEYRDQLRLNVSTQRIQTDRKIAAEENANRELTEGERMETDRKLSLIKSENDATVKRDHLERGQAAYEQERVIQEDRFRKEAEFAREQQESQYRKEIQEQELKKELQELEQRVLENELELEKVRVAITEEKLGPVKSKRLIEQTHTQEALAYELISGLPRIYEALKIDNYSIMNTGGSGDVSPVSRVLQEVIGVLRSNGMEGVLENLTGGGSAPRGSGGDSGNGPGDFDIEELPGAE